MRPIGARTKLNVALGCILLVSAMGMSAVTYRLFQRSLRESVVDGTLPLLADNIHSEIQHDVMSPVYVSSLMAHDAFLQDWALDGEGDVAQITRYLADIQQEYSFVSAFFVSETTRNYYHSSGILKQISSEDDHDAWYFSFLDLEVDSDLDVDTDEAADGRLTVFINHRLMGPAGELLGVTGVGLSMDQLGAMLREYRQSYGREVYLVDGEGLVQVHPNASLIERQGLHDMDGVCDVAHHLLSGGVDSSNVTYQRGKETVIVNTRYIEAFDWYLVVEQDESAMYAPLRWHFVRNGLMALVVTLVVIALCSMTVNAFQTRLERLATTDDLTDVANRRHFLELAEVEMLRTARSRAPTCVAMADIDHFKRVNDAHGHRAGDSVLRAVAGACKEALRGSDILGRVGGEEFAIVLPQAALEDAMQIAERVRAGVAACGPDIAGESATITISVGVAAVDPESPVLGEAFARADRALYRAKEGGRDRVVAAEPPTGQSEQSPGA